MQLREIFTVENLAYGGKTWVNDQRQQWSDWTRGLASLAVDGNHDRNLSSCAVVENFKNEEPVWMVDLGKRKQVNGVVLITWQGHGEGMLIIIDYSCII